MDNIKIVTFNLRCSWGKCGDEINSGIYRIGPIVEKINAEKPDVVSFQEVIEPALSMLKRTLNDYIFVGQFRNKDYTGEGLYTALRKDTVELIGLDAFWIGPEPYVPESRFESQSECPRICVTSTIRHKISGERIRVYNIHLDHVGEFARVEGIKCVMDIAVSDKQKGGLPMVLLGDFNAKPDSETIEFCNNFKAIPLTEATKDIKATFHNYGRITDCKIDYIYVSDELKGKIKKVTTWEDENCGIYLSDHYPVVMELEV